MFNYWRAPSVFSPKYVVESPAGSMKKLKGVADVAHARGLADIVTPTPVTVSQLKALHAPGYVDAFCRGQGPVSQSNNLKWSESLVEAVFLMNGGMLTAAEIACREGVALNLAHGFHHAHYDQGEAYCTFNGLALVASELKDRKVFVLDMDQHGGNGTEGFCRRLQNLTAFSIHGSSFGCTGGTRSHVRKLTGLTHDATPLWDAMDEAFELAEDADLVIFQAGMDCHHADPHGSMGLTSQHIQQRDRMVVEWAEATQKPLVVTLAGGYQEREALIDLHVGTIEAIVDCHREVQAWPKLRAQG